MVKMFTTRGGVSAEAAIIDISMKKVSPSDECYHLCGFSPKVSCKTPFSCHAGKMLVQCDLLALMPMEGRSPVNDSGASHAKQRCSILQKQLKAKNTTEKPHNQPEKSKQNP